VKAKKPTPLFNAFLSAEEKSFAIYCFFDDFNVVREHVEDTWHDYELGNLDLAAAAMITKYRIRIVPTI
jgi:hypothetical protein